MKIVLIGGVLVCVAACGSDGSPPQVADFEKLYPELTQETAHDRVSAYDETTCVVTHDGDVQCWGGRLDAVSLLGEVPFTKVTVGAIGVCGLREDGSVGCADREIDGQQVQLTGLEGYYIDVSAGDEHVCAVTTAHDIECVGLGQRWPVAGEFVSVSAGGFYTCAVDAAGGASCWQSADPIGHLYDVPGITSQISAGTDHVCNVDPDGRIMCWGDDSRRQNRVPAGVYAYVDAGDDSTCGVLAMGGITCWGELEVGMGAVDCRSVTHGRSHACATSAAGTITCWGSDPAALPPTVALAP